MKSLNTDSVMHLIAVGDSNPVPRQGEHSAARAGIRGRIHMLGGRR
jgi:hypothetical protein